ncbi:hypothetical protein ACQ4PT_027055 [Festuca glaucescens]
MTGFRYADASLDALPTCVDWRTKGAVTPVKDEGQCGCCWAFFTVASVEGIVQLSTSKLISLSEQELLDCDTSDNRCRGGLMDNAFEFIVENGGFTIETNYPYTGTDGTCNSNRASSSASSIKGHEDVLANDEASLQKAVTAQPVSMALDGRDDLFRFYKGAKYWRFGMAVVSRAHASLPSSSSSPLPAFSPQSPQPKVERMFTRGGSGRSSSSASGTNRRASLREIDEEATILEDEDDDGGGGELYVAVGKDVKDGRSNLLWAARNLLAGDLKLVLLHVHQPAERIMTGLCKVSASQLEEKELKAYRKIEKEDMKTLLNQYLNFCRVSLKMQAETLVIEKNSPATGIIELIDQNHIAKLVMGTSSISVKQTVFSQFKARENSLHKEKKEVEERLTREKTGLEKEHIHICNELQKANEQRAELESKLLQTNSLMEELQQLQGELQREKDYAIRQAEEMRQISGNTVFGSTGAVALTEFSYEEIKEATNDFNDSKKIGQGGCGSVYKGFLRHTTVAIKKFNREGTTGEKEFNDEVETLCRMRHPNLVTLIGVCREAKALVFEFLSNGSLEDCLQCKHQTEPLSWRMRIRIAADICTGLIFLHSNKPKGIAHGDLKPDNVLLDTSFICKLADFGISRPLNLTNTTVTPYHRTNQIKGTMGYMDPGYIASGEITAQYDVYSFGVVLMRLLTGKSPLGLPNEVEAALSNDMLQDIIDTSAGEWPPEHTEALARLALRCCRYERKERPDLAKEAWSVLQAMVNCPDDKRQPPTFFICPMTQEIMRDPHIAADGFTYEGEAIKDWLQRGHKMSPMTYLSFTHHELIPNTALRFAIQEWQMQHQP